MTYLIFKSTRREAESQRRESLAKEHLDPQRFRGTAGTAEEAHDKQRGLERDGEQFDRLWAIANDSPEAKLAEQSLSRFRTPFEWEK